MDGENSTENVRSRVKLIKCTFNGCKGFLSSVWKCGLCSNWTCPSAEVRGTEKTQSTSATQTSQPQNSSRATPAHAPTNEGIYKIEGCARCVHLVQSSFDWNTGKIIAEIYTTHITSSGEETTTTRETRRHLGRTHHQIPKQILSV
jgi:hypothetical protein